MEQTTTDLFGKLVNSGLIPFLILAAVTWLSFHNTTRLVGSQRKEDTAKRKETIYEDCLRHLLQSRCTNVDWNGTSDWLSHDDYLGRMATLQYAVPWMIMAASLSSGAAKTEINNRADDLSKTIEAVRHSEPFRVYIGIGPNLLNVLPNKRNPRTGEELNYWTLIQGHGLPQAIDSALDTVTKHSRDELCRNEFR